MFIDIKNKKKLRKFRLKGVKIKGKLLYFGYYGLVSLETVRIDPGDIQRFTQIIRRQVKLKGGKGSKFWFYYHDSISVTQIPIGTRMGKGKGNIIKQVAFIRKGHILCELSVLKSSIAYDIFKIAASKLPVKCKIVTY